MPDLIVTALQRKGLGPVDLSVSAGEAFAIHGLSGSGKTLLLRAIADLDPNDGEIVLGDSTRGQLAAHQWRSLLMYVPPESHWWADTVRQHAELWEPTLLSALGFDNDVLDWQVRRLSNGERQRLALARALSAGPAGLLLDEPTANLDEMNTRRVEQLVNDYRKTHNAPVLWVSHDAAQRRRMAQREGEMVRGRLQ